MKLAGVYTVAGFEDVHLMEFIIPKAPEDIEIGDFTQSLAGIDRLDWQAPYDESYLNEEGSQVIGQFGEIPKNQASTRLVFFFHYLDFEAVFSTPFGEVKLMEPVKMPDRLIDLIEYEGLD